MTISICVSLFIAIALRVILQLFNGILIEFKHQEINFIAFYYNFTSKLVISRGQNHSPCYNSNIP